MPKTQWSIMKENKILGMRRGSSPGGSPQTRHNLLWPLPGKWIFMGKKLYRWFFFSFFSPPSGLAWHSTDLWRFPVNHFRSRVANLLINSRADLYSKGCRRDICKRHSSRALWAVKSPTLRCQDKNHALTDNKHKNSLSIEPLIFLETPSWQHEDGHLLKSLLNLLEQITVASREESLLLSVWSTGN